jgi:hypothetical protein
MQTLAGVAVLPEVLGIEDTMILHVITINVVLLQHNGLATKLLRVILNVGKLPPRVAWANQQRVRQPKDFG